MKKIFITLLVGFFGLISFSNAQFIENKEISFNCYPNRCSPSSYSFEGGISSLNLELNSSDTSSNLNFTINCSNGSQIIYDDFSSNFVQFNVGQSKVFSCPGSKISSVNFSSSTRNTVFKGSYGLLTSKMPVSEFAPVINGLESVVNEFIPYVVYIGIGLISAVIGFVAVRRLINWVRGKSLGVFRSKKK